MLASSLKIVFGVEIFSCHPSEDVFLGLAVSQPLLGVGSVGPTGGLWTAGGQGTGNCSPYAVVSP